MGKNGTKANSAQLELGLGLSLAISKIVATYVYASSQGQHTHSAWTKIIVFGLKNITRQVYVRCYHIYLYRICSSNLRTENMNVKKMNSQHKSSQSRSSNEFVSLFVYFIHLCTLVNIFRYFVLSLLQRNCLQFDFLD